MSPVRALIVTSLALGASVVSSGCSDDAGSTACGGHGVLHGDHCDCDPGFTHGANDLTCVARDDVTDTTDTKDVTDATAATDVQQDTHDGGHDTTADAGDTAEQDAADGVTEADPLSFAPADPVAVTGLGDDDARVWLLEGVDGANVLGVEIYEAYGGPTAPGTVTLTAAETDYLTCGTCLVLRTGCESHGDHYDCARTFMPTVGGAVHLDAIADAVGGRLAGTLDGVVFREVTIGSDHRTETVVGGQRYALDAWAFDLTLGALGGGSGGGECGGHGERHGDHCHRDPGYEPDPSDETRCVPE